MLTLEYKIIWEGKKVHNNTNSINDINFIKINNEKDIYLALSIVVAIANDINRNQRSNGN